MQRDLKRSSSAVLVRWTAALLVALSGCGQRPVAGGTPGVLTTDGNPLPEVKLTMYSAESGERLGFAVTGSDGKFELLTPGAASPLRLDSGAYIVTLESVGAPAILPQEYLECESTPLKIDWVEGRPIQLNVPSLELNFFRG